MILVDERNGAFGVLRVGRETEGENLPKYYVVHRRSHMNSPGIDLGLQHRELVALSSRRSFRAPKEEEGV
jgi:hypothetical protein